MTLVTGEVKSPGGLTKLGTGTAQAYLVNHAAENAPGRRSASNIKT